ncbi:MAG TPA: DNA-3-methyladenine glycosylase 2 family protein [Nevskiaceae bacterium]|nr:DNA-3-methyladenine glycosylase 2 family protein [Nevskiaceae bacterium]
MISAATLRNAETVLSAADPRLGELIRRHRPCRLGRRRRDPFHVLCTSIINQQLSTTAADAIQARVAAVVGANPLFTPAHFHGVDPGTLRAAGLSTAKSKWLVQIAQLIATRQFSFAKLRRMDDETAIEALDALPGIGRWSAEMFLIFALNRPDVFAMGDVGLRRGVEKLHNRGAKLDVEATRAITERWAPWRSIASWYLWRIDDADEGAWK